MDDGAVFNLWAEGQATVESKFTGLSGTILYDMVVSNYAARGGGGGAWACGPCGMRQG